MKYDELVKKYQAKVDKSSGTDGQTLQQNVSNRGIRISFSVIAI